VRQGGRQSLERRHRPRRCRQVQCAVVRVVAPHQTRSVGALEVPNSRSARQPSMVYELGVAVDACVGAFFRTRLVQVRRVVVLCVVILVCCTQS
jgi:hypothetical protein